MPCAVSAQMVPNPLLPQGMNRRRSEANASPSPLSAVKFLTFTLRIKKNDGTIPPI
jgi:exo-beta-1,3-glucanase (GH17 family)